MAAVIGSQVAAQAVTEITAQLSSLALDKEVRDGKIKAAKAASQSPWDRRLTFDAKKHIAIFLDAKDLLTCYQLLEKCLGSVSSAATAELQLSDIQATNLTLKLVNKNYSHEREAHFRKIADRVINLNLNGDRTEGTLTNMLNCFPRLQVFSYWGQAKGTFLASLSPAIKKVSLIISNLDDKYLQCLQKCPALEVLEVSSKSYIGASFSALPLSLHTLKLECYSYLLSFEDLARFVQLSPMRRLRIEFKVAKKLMEHIETEEIARTIAKQVSHLDLRNGSEISEEMLAQTLPFFENLEALNLPSVQTTGSCLDVVPRSLKLLDVKNSVIDEKVADLFFSAVFNFSTQHPQCKMLFLDNFIGRIIDLWLDEKLSDVARSAIKKIAEHVDFLHLRRDHKQFSDEELEKIFKLFINVQEIHISKNRTATGTCFQHLSRSLQRLYIHKCPELEKRAQEVRPMGIPVIIDNS